MNIFFGPWQNSPSALAGMVRELPIAWVEQFVAHPIQKTEQEMELLKEQIVQDGLEKHIFLLVGQKDRRIRIWDGHHRLQALKELGELFVPVQCQAWTEAKPIYYGYETKKYPFMSKMKKEDQSFRERSYRNPDEIFDQYVLLPKTA